LAAARAQSAVPLGCRCARLDPDAGAWLCAAHARLSALHRAVGFPLLPQEATAVAGDSCCMPVLSALSAAQTLVATTAVAVLTECGTRVAWLASGAPGAPPGFAAAPARLRAARRQLLAACALDLLLCAAALPLLWEVCGAAARWWQGGRPGPLELLAFVTATGVQVFMRLVWLPAVWQLAVAGGSSLLVLLPSLWKLPRGGGQQGRAGGSPAAASASAGGSSSVSSERPTAGAAANGSRSSSSARNAPSDASSSSELRQRGVTNRAVAGRQLR
jgi:hypothetical protein